MRQHRTGGAAHHAETNGTRGRCGPRIRFDTGFPLAYAALFAALLIFIGSRYFSVGDTGVETDFYGELAVAARELWRGGFAVANYPYKGPVYSFVLVGFYALLREWYRSGAVLNTVFAAAGLVFLYRFILRLFNRPVALFTMIAVSLVSEFFLIAHKASSDMLFFFLCVVAIERVIAARISWFRVCCAGVLGALAFLTRYIGAFLPAATVVTLLLVNPAGLTVRRRISYTLLYCCVFAAVCAPWFVASYRASGMLLSTRNLENVVHEFYGDRDAPAGGFSSLGDVVSNDPLSFAAHYLSNIPRHFRRDMTGTLHAAAGILAVLGLLRLLLAAPTRAQGGYLLFALFYFLPLCAVFHLTRFSIPLLPVYYAFGFSVLFAAPRANITRLGERLGIMFSPQARLVRRLWHARLGSVGPSVRFVVCAAVIAVLLFLQVVRIVRYERMYYARRPLFVVTAARFLRRTPHRTRLTETPTLMARKPHIAFYADTRFQYYPDGFYNSQHFLSFAIERDVDFIVVSSLEMVHYPDAEYLWALDTTPGVEKIYGTDEVAIFTVEEWLKLDTEAGREQLAGYESDLARAAAEDDPEGEIRACLNVAGMYAMNGAWDKKARYLERALSAARRLTEPSSRTRYITLLKLNVSEAYLMAGSHEEGIALLEEYLPMIEERGTPEQRALAHVLISRHHEELGRLHDARRHLSIVLDIYRSRGDTKRAAMVERAMRRLSGGSEEQ